MIRRRGNDPTTFPVAVAVISTGIFVGAFLAVLVLTFMGK